MTTQTEPSFINFADPYKKCMHCGAWVDGVRRGPGPSVLVPCGCRSGYKDVCPSWGPVDGCTCAQFNARNQVNPHSEPIVHPARERTPGDGKVY